MPTLSEGSTGAVVRSLQQVLSNGASGQWNTSPGAIDGNFGPNTKASVQAFQTWGGVAADGIVGDQTQYLSLRVANALTISAGGQRCRGRHVHLRKSFIARSSGCFLIDCDYQQLLLLLLSGMWATRSRCPSCPQRGCSRSCVI